jgi:hypothetical protein
MKKLVLFIFAVAVAGILATVPTSFSHSNIAQAPAGHTGAPGETTCNTSGCHTGSPVLENDPNIMFNAVSPSFTSGYTPGTLYNVIVNAGNAPRHGFQLTALDAQGNNAGTLALGAGTNADFEALSSANGRQYIGHKDATGRSAWTFKWTAPASGDVYFYLAVNNSNNDNTNSGDQIRQRTYKLTRSSFTDITYSVGITEVKNADEAGINVFPNPVSDVMNISYAISGETVKADIYNLNGQLVKPLFQEQADGHATHSIPMNNELATGIYLVRFGVGEQVYFKKILVK